MITTEKGDQATSYMKTDNKEAHKQAERLALYLWDNYIETADAEKIFFMGVGNAFHGIVKLLCEKGKKPTQPKRPPADSYPDQVHHRVGGVIVFIAHNPVRPVMSYDNPDLTRWYSRNSLVLVAYVHGLWVGTGDRKMSRRYGSVKKSPGRSLGQMLVMHAEDIFQWIAGRAGLALAPAVAAVDVPQIRAGPEDIVLTREGGDERNGIA